MQGFNMGRYYPPPESSDSPAFNSASHPLGHRAKKLRSEGILTVRFEMPFAMWCGTCPKPTIIGQGVRFNAEKKKVGSYYSTPIWQFRMKHAACGGWIEIRTDPKQTEYVVVEGGKRRDYGDERREEEGEMIDTEQRDRQREDAMAGLEGKRDEEKIKKEAGQRIAELVDDRERFWKDPYEASRFVRKGFRRDRKERKREHDRAEDLKDRLGIDVTLLPEDSRDSKLAALVDYGAPALDGASEASTRPLFEIKAPTRNGGTDTKSSMNTKRARAQARDKQAFEQTLHSTTRAAQDPFATEGPTITKAERSSRHAILGIKKTQARPETPTAAGMNALVAYDSD